MPVPPPKIGETSIASRVSHPSATLKRRRASSAPCEDEHERQRKRSRGNAACGFVMDEIREESDDDVEAVPCVPHSDKGKRKADESIPAAVASHSLASGGVTASLIDDLAQELICGCCTELCYNPVIVNPCQHFFCGSCCVLWVRNGGTNCPACRSISTSVTPSRILQSIIDLILRFDPSRARTTNERSQADQVYRAGVSLRLPTPRPATPEPNLEPPNDNFARPCPTCHSGNPFGWRCPVPIPDPAVDRDIALDLDEGLPDGHNFCGNCDQLHNVQAPTSSRCDLCLVSFCGVGIQGRCCAMGILVQQAQGMAELQDLILNGTVYECFQKNSVEIDILVDYLRMNEISLHSVYKEITMDILQKPSGFTPLIQAGVFDDLYPVSGGEDSNPSAPRRKICRLCAAQVLMYGIKDWWIRERARGNLPAEVLARKDCSEGCFCNRQIDQAHAKEYNHIIPPPAPPPIMGDSVVPAPPVTNGSNVPAVPHEAPTAFTLANFLSSEAEARRRNNPGGASSNLDTAMLNLVEPVNQASSPSHQSSQEVEGMTGSSSEGSIASATATHVTPPSTNASPQAPEVPEVRGGAGDVIMVEGRDA